MLYADKFAHNPTHTPKDFRRYFSMNKELLIKILIGVREYDEYFCCKKNTASNCLGSPPFRNARLL
jgi:hypothetical protein